MAARFGVAVSSAVKWSQRYRSSGSVAPGKMGGHRKRVLEPHRAFILERINNQDDRAGVGMAREDPDGNQLAPNEKSPLPGGGDSGLDLENGAGGGAPYSTSASHLGGVDGRRINDSDGPRYCNAQNSYRSAKNLRDSAMTMAQATIPFDTSGRRQLARQLPGGLRRRAIAPVRPRNVDRRERLDTGLIISVEPPGHGTVEVENAEHAAFA